MLRGGFAYLRSALTEHAHSDLSELTQNLV